MTRARMIELLRWIASQRRLGRMVTMSADEAEQIAVELKGTP